MGRLNCTEVSDDMERVQSAIPKYVAAISKAGGRPQDRPRLPKTAQDHPRLPEPAEELF